MPLALISARGHARGQPALQDRRRGEEAVMGLMPIVVGVDGSEESLRAVEWAALEARRHKAPFLKTIGKPGPPVQSSETNPLRYGSCPTSTTFFGVGRIVFTWCTISSMLPDGFRCSLNRRLSCTFNPRAMISAVSRARVSGLLRMASNEISISRNTCASCLVRWMPFVVSGRSSSL